MARKSASKWLLLACVAAIFITAGIIIATSYAVVGSGAGSRDERDTTAVGTGAGTEVERPSSSPLDLVPDPSELEGKRKSFGYLTPTVPTKGSSDDDGELHDGWDESVSYSMSEERFQRSGEEALEAYGTSVVLDLDVSYPQFSDAGEHTDELNELLRDTAMTTADDFVNNPSEEAVSIVLGSVDETGLLGGSTPLVTSEVTWAVTRNTEDLVSVSFSDHFMVGSYAGEYIRLRCVNMNLETGEAYSFDDVLTMNEQLAQHFVDVFVENAGNDENGDGVISDDECFSVAIIGREEWVRALMGEGEYAHRVATEVFVDEKGRANMGVTYWLGNERGVSRGWWDATLSDELLDGARKDSSFWELLEKPEADG